MDKKQGVMTTLQWRINVFPERMVFHPVNRWVLFSSYSGAIQLLDCNQRYLIGYYDAHIGNVHALDFHKSKPLFVSGGNDSKIKVWNYNTGKCLCTFEAHAGKVRSTFFHHKYPWILSASDDKTIRIWNWQSRSNVAVMKGHKEGVRCARFHPTQDLIVSVSRDKTLRIWDISSLTIQQRSPSTPSPDAMMNRPPKIPSKTVRLKVPEEGKTGRIDWCSFHPDPSKELCVTVEVGCIRMWKMDAEVGLRQVSKLDTYYRFRYATFSPQGDMVVVHGRGAEKIYDLDLKVELFEQTMNVCKIPIKDVHQTERIFVGYHRSRLVVFKLEKERPIFTVVNDHILFIKGTHIHKYNMLTQETSVLATLKPRPDLTTFYHKIHCHSYEEDQPCQVVVTMRKKYSNAGAVDLYNIDGSGGLGSGGPVRTAAKTGIFVGEKRYAVCDGTSAKLLVDGAEQQPGTAIPAKEIHESYDGRLFVTNLEEDDEDDVSSVFELSLWDGDECKQMAKIRKSDFKHVVVSGNREYIAYIGSNTITICDGKLNVLRTIVEQRKIKSAIWTEDGVLLYTTQLHAKYALLGPRNQKQIHECETTTIGTLRGIWYIAAVRNDTVFWLNTRSEVEHFKVDPREFRFKLAVMKNERDAILASAQELGYLRWAEISLLIKRGHYGLALMNVFRRSSLKRRAEFQSSSWKSSYYALFIIVSLIAFVWMLISNGSLSLFSLFS